MPVAIRAARVLMICQPGSDLHEAAGQLENAGHTVRTSTDLGSIWKAPTPTCADLDVAVVDLGMPGIHATEIMTSCDHNDLALPIILVADENDTGKATQIVERPRMLHLAGPLDTLLLNALVALAADMTRRLREWKSHMAQLEQEAEDRAQSLEAARSEIEKSLHDLQQAQSQLLQSEKMASIGQLAAGVAHEINNPIGFIYSNMNTLSGYVATIKEFAQRCGKAHESLLAGNAQNAVELVRELDEWSSETELNYVLEDIESLVAETVEGAERVKKIVLDLRSFSRAEEDHKTTVDINKGLEMTISLCRNELKYHCEVVKELGDIPALICFPMKLNQVFMNLIVNAAHAIKDKGTVTIRTRQDGDDIFVHVSDTGCGISQEHLDKIFEPFFTTKPVGKGTGLGLSIACSIIAQHSGEITVESEVGKGTTFTVRLPIVEPEDA